MVNTKLFAALFTLFVLFCTGVVFYTKVEKWSVVDSFYFTGITLTTIGYGDITPKTDEGKIFTVFFSIMGVALTLFALTAIAENYFNRRMALLQSIQKRVESLAEIPKMGVESIRDIHKNIKNIPKKIVEGMKAKEENKESKEESSEEDIYSV